MKIRDLLKKLKDYYYSISYGTGNSFPWIYALIANLESILDTYDIDDETTRSICYTIAYGGGLSLITSQIFSYYQRLAKPSLRQQGFDQQHFEAFKKFGNRILLILSGIGGLVKALGATCTTSLVCSNLLMLLYTLIWKDEPYYENINKIIHAVTLLLSFWLIFPDVAFSQGTTLANKFFPKTKERMPDNTLTRLFYWYLSKHHPHSIGEICNGSGTLVYGYDNYLLINEFSSHFLQLSTKAVKLIGYISIIPIVFFCFFVLTVVDINFRDQLISFKRRLPDFLNIESDQNYSLLTHEDEISRLCCCNGCSGCCPSLNRSIRWLQHKEDVLVTLHPWMDYFSSSFKTFVTLLSTMFMLLKHVFNRSSHLQKAALGHFSYAEIISILLSIFFFTPGTYQCTLSLAKENRPEKQMPVPIAGKPEDTESNEDDEDDELVGAKSDRSKQRFSDDARENEMLKSHNKCGGLFTAFCPPEENSIYSPQLVDYSCMTIVTNFFLNRCCPSKDRKRTHNLVFS